MEQQQSSNASTTRNRCPRRRQTSLKDNWQCWLPRWRTRHRRNRAAVRF
jgi:hypothetical protein